MHSTSPFTSSLTPQKYVPAHEQVSTGTRLWWVITADRPWLGWRSSYPPCPWQSHYLFLVRPRHRSRISLSPHSCSYPLGRRRSSFESLNHSLKWSLFILLLSEPSFTYLRDIFVLKKKSVLLTIYSDHAFPSSKSSRPLHIPLPPNSIPFLYV